MILTLPVVDLTLPSDEELQHFTADFCDTRRLKFEKIFFRSIKFEFQRMAVHSPTALPWVGVRQPLQGFLQTETILKCRALNLHGS